MTPTATSNLTAALAYARRGWAVFPCRPAGKEPLTPHGCRDATTDEATIRAWWRRWPGANIGVATGPVSGLVVLDVDGQEGEESLAALVAQHGPLPATPEVLTPGAGRHIYFKHPPGASVRCAVRLGGWPGLDLRAEGGYVVAPPSTHPSGRPYAWEVSSNPDDVPLAEPPAWLLALATERGKPAGGNGHEPAPLPEVIVEGGRNATLASVAGSLRRRGASEAAIRAALLAINEAQCRPPLPAKEVEAIARSVARYEPEPPAPRLVLGQRRGEPEADPDDAAQMKDYGHAAVLARLFQGRYRWAVHRGSWMAYDGRVWRAVPEEAVAKAASDALRKEYAAQLAAATDKAAVLELTKKVNEACTYARITGALAFLKGWPGFLTMSEEWDRDPWLLNVRNGTLDLRTGALRPHDPADLITKLAPVTFDPQARGEKWAAHVERFLPNPDVRRQVQRDLGLALVGATLEESLPIWYGTGANGKTTTARVLLGVLGDYADRAAPNLLVQSKYERHPTEVADLCGLRLAFSVEVDQGKHLAEALVKELTGGDRKKGRFMRQDFFSFEQTFSITLIVNHKPIVTGTDEGIWRRLRLIPWEYRIPDAERRPQEEVVAELLGEGPAILNWLLAGLADWRRDRNWTAPEVRAASDAYRAEMDILGDFLRERCILGPRYTVPKASLYAAYLEWCEQNHERPVSQKTFTRLLEDRGIGSDKGTHGTRLYIGIGLRTDHHDNPPPGEVADGGSFSVSPHEKSKLGDYTENVPPSATRGETAPTVAPEPAPPPPQGEAWPFQAYFRRGEWVTPVQGGKPARVVSAQVAVDKRIVYRLEDGRTFSQAELDEAEPPPRGP